MPRAQKISRIAAAFTMLPFAFALALAFASTLWPDAAENAHADAKPIGTIEGMRQIPSNPMYDGTPQQGYGGAPYCTYRDDAGAEQTYAGPFAVTYTGIVHANTADEHSYGPTAKAPTQAGSYRVELSLPDSAPCTAAPSGKSFLIERAPLFATVSPGNENATRPYDDYSQSSTFADIKLEAFTGLAPADEGKVDITATGDALKQDAATGTLIPDANVATEDGTPTGKLTGKPFRATSVSYNNPTSLNYDLQEDPHTYRVSGEVMIVKKPMPNINDPTKHTVWNEYGAFNSMPVSPMPNGSTSASYTIITDIKTTQGLSDAKIEDVNGVAKLTVYANGKGDDAHDAVTVRMSALENHEDFNVTLHVEYERHRATIEGVTKLPSPIIYDGQPHAGFEGTPTAFYIDHQGKRIDYGASPDEAFVVSYTGTTAGGTPYDAITPPTNAGVYQVTISISPHQVCKGSTAFAFAIDKAPAFATVPADARLQPSGATTIDLASMPALPDDVGSGPVYTVKSSTTEGLASTSVDNASGMLVLTAKADASESATDVVIVELSDMGNYENSAIEVSVRYARADGVVTGPVPVTGLVYSGKPQTGYTGAPEAVYTPAGTTDPLSYNGPFNISYTGATVNGVAYGPTDQAPSAAGTYRVEFAAPGTAPVIAAPLALDFAIGRAPLAFRAENASMIAGDAMPKLDYEVTGLQGFDRVTQEPLLAVEGDTESAGTCAIAISDAVVDNQASYDVSYARGVLTVNAAPKPEPEPAPEPEPKPQPARPEVKPLAPTAKPEAKLATPEHEPLASTGDAAPLGLFAFATVTGGAALVIGTSFAVAKRVPCQRLRSGSKRE